MRLIDADRIKKELRFLTLMGDSITFQVVGRPYGENKGEVTVRVGDYIDNQPTIDSIPVEWIKKYVEKNRNYSPATVREVMALLDEWRKDGNNSSTDFRDSNR